MSGKNNVYLAKIFWLGNNLQYCRLKATYVLDSNVKFKVKGNKGESSLIETLEKINAILQEYDITPNIQKQIQQNWIPFLNQYYIQASNQPFEDIFSPIHITKENSRELISDINQWRREILSSLEIDFYAPFKIETALIDKSKLTSGIESFLKDDSLTLISENAKQDLNDAIKCILFSLPTPAAMITFRASEDVLRLYYEKKTPNSAEGKRWYEIIQELSKIEGANKPFVDYLNYIRDKRNEAEHPGKTFTQSESEHAFLQVTHLIEVISKDIK